MVLQNRELEQAFQWAQVSGTWLIKAAIQALGLRIIFFASGQRGQIQTNLF